MRCSLRGFGVNSCGWQLKNCSLLTFFQECQRHKPTIREFQRVMMEYRFVLVDLSKDCGLVEDNVLTPWPQMYAPNFIYEGQLRPGEYAQRHALIFRCTEASCSRGKLASD
jgi:hypothetical protein